MVFQGLESHPTLCNLVEECHFDILPWPHVTAVRQITRRIFDCCWKQTADPHYQDDGTGIYILWTNLDTSNPLNETFPLFNSEERKAKAARLLREQGPAEFRRFVFHSHGPKSAMQDWDLEVYLGTFERLPTSHTFHWRDTHWQMDEVELLKRVDAWNTALALYCDDVGLTGQSRDQVIQKHSANPCAPCANLSCTKHETKCKEFYRCSRCKRVSYCSSTCQRQHWKKHKKNCFAI
jgi:MYND finger